MNKQMNNSLDERYYTEDYFKKVYQQEVERRKNFDIEIGDCVFFNKEEHTMNIINEFDEELNGDLRDFNKYIPIGIVVDYSENKKSIMIASIPYMFSRLLYVKQFDKASELLKLLDNEISCKTNNVISQCGGSSEIKFFIPNKTDIARMEKNDMRLIHNGIEMMIQLTFHYVTESNYSINNIFYGNILTISENKKDIEFIIGGLQPNFSANYLIRNDNFYTECSYSTMSTEDFLKRVSIDNNENTNGIIPVSDENDAEKEDKKTVYDCNYRMTFSDIKKVWKKLDLMDFTVIPFAVISVSE